MSNTRGYHPIITFIILFFLLKNIYFPVGILGKNKTFYEKAALFKTLKTIHPMRLMSLFKSSPCLERKRYYIQVINPQANDRDDLMQDFVSIITSFTARLYGQRRTKRNTEKLIKELEK